ncbi:MAG: ROK family protein [Cytophagaceae bacterium]
MYKIGIDLGGTKIEGIILDEKLNEVFRKRIATEQEGGYEHILNNIKKLYNELVREIKNNDHTFGIGTPGSISSHTGLMKNSNTICLNGKPLVSDLEKLINRKVVIENDANCFAIAEALMGAGKNYDMVFGVIMGTGCGGGIVYKGNVITGKQKIAGEWGHSTIDPKNGPACYCGKRGCVETYISGGGLEARYFEVYQQKKKAEQIFTEYKIQEEKSVKIVHDFFDHFGIALSNLINILDPDLVVLGGGLSNLDELYSLGINSVRKYIFNDTLITPIVKNHCGDSAGVWGAALIGN